MVHILDKTERKIELTGAAREDIYDPPAAVRDG